MRLEGYLLVTSSLLFAKSVVTLINLAAQCFQICLDVTSKFSSPTRNLRQI